MPVKVNRPWPSVVTGFGQARRRAGQARPRSGLGMSKRPPPSSEGLAVDAPQPDFNPSSRLTVHVDKPAADELLGLEVDLSGGLLGIRMELDAAKPGASTGCAGQGVDIEEAGRRGAEASMRKRPSPSAAPGRAGRRR